MDSGVEVLRAQALLLKVFIMTGGRQSAEYIKVLSASIMLWGFYESSQHPCWELFRNNASAFNEESGEISLSVLARDVSRGGVRSDCAKVSQTYALVKAKAELAQDIGVDIAGDDFGSDSHGRRIKVDSAEVLSTAAYFTTVIRHILAGTYRHYDKTCGVLGKGVTTARVTVPMAAFTASFRSVTPDLKQTVNKLKSNTVSFWVAPHVDIWPGAVPAIEWDASDEEEAGGAAGGAGQAPPAQNVSQKKRAAGSAGAAAPSKKPKVSKEKFVGCVLAVPAYKFGAAWAGMNFQRAMKAVLIGDCVSFDPENRFTPYSCRMREDKDYMIKLSAKEVEEFHLVGEAAASAQDTPWKHGKEVNE